MIVRSIIEDVTEGLDSLDIKYSAEINLNSEKKRIVVNVYFSSIGYVARVFSVDALVKSKLHTSDLVRYHFNKEIAKHYRKIGESK